MSDAAAFSAHLRRLNARRLGLASWYFAVLVALLLIANVALPALRLWQHAAVQAFVAVYFVALGFVCRLPQAGRWPTPVLPLLFGSATVATGLVFSLDLAPALGANPAYATTLLLGCVAPLWPRRLLLAALVPVHLLYLLIVFMVGQGVVFVLLMGIGGTVAAALGWFVAVLQYRTVRQAFDTAATIGRQKDELVGALARVSRLLDQRSEMVATVAHDLQSPLAGIRALLRTIPTGADGDAPKLREIARTCGDMQAAIARLLDAHAAESGADALQEVDLERLFAEVIAVVAPAAAEKGIAVTGDAGRLRALAEPRLLAHALGNLLSNAVKFSPPGRPVRLEARARGSALRLSVIDRGPGVAPDDTALLFRKFARLGAQPTGNEPTSGLGLYIVRGLAERMGGTAGFEPNPRGGSAFFLDLPQAGRAVTPSRS